MAATTRRPWYHDLTRRLLFARDSLGDCTAIVARDVSPGDAQLILMAVNSRERLITEARAAGIRVEYLDGARSANELFEAIAAAQKFWEPIPEEVLRVWLPAEAATGSEEDFAQGA